MQAKLPTTHPSLKLFISPFHILNLNEFFFLPCHHVDFIHGLIFFFLTLLNLCLKTEKPKKIKIENRNPSSPSLIRNLFLLYDNFCFGIVVWLLCVVGIDFWVGSNLILLLLNEVPNFFYLTSCSMWILTFCDCFWTLIILCLQFGFLRFNCKRVYMNRLSTDELSIGKRGCRRSLA